MSVQPQVVATVATSESRQRHAGSSFTLSSEGRKKRPEVVLATDSGSIEVYDIRRNSRSLTSHGIPPGERLLCPPVSTVLKRDKSRPQERFTYWATSLERGNLDFTGRAGQFRINCLHESEGQSKAVTVALGSVEAPISFPNSLEILPALDTEEARHLLLVLHADLKVTEISIEDGKAPVTEQLPLPGGFLNSSIEFATTLSLSDARQALLKARDDVLGRIGQPTGPVLAIVLWSRQLGLKIFYFHISARPTALFSLSIPDSAATSRHQVILHTRTAKLYDLRRSGSEHFLHVYDVGGLASNLETSMQIPEISSFVRISPNSIAVLSEAALSIYDVRWKYLQKTIYHSDSGPLQLLNYFPLSATVALMDKSSLISLDLRQGLEIDGRLPRKWRTGGLADAIGKRAGMRSAPIAQGNIDVSSEVLGKKLIPSYSATTAAEIKKRFDPLLLDSSSGTYDEAMLHALQTVSNSKKGSSIGYVAQPDLIAYAVGGLFSRGFVDGQGQLQLRVRRMAPETFRFLLTHGLLTVSQVQRSLRVGGHLDHQERLADSSIIQALTDHDETLQALIYYLSSAPLLSVDEICFGLVKCLIAAQEVASRNSTRDNKGPKLLTDGQISTGSSLTIQNTSSEDGPMNTDGSDAAFDGDWPDPDPEEDLAHNARSALGSCLTRLSACADSDIRDALRKTMSSSHILTLIDYIRMELSSGGWLARYLDEDLQGEEDLSTQTNQVRIAAKILNCAIDSLGATTWLLGTGTDTEMAQSIDKVAYMQAEINATLEGIENAAYLEHVLHEALRYASSAEEGSGSNANPEIVSIPLAGENNEAQMLPLGMKKETISRIRITAGGKEVVRSARDIGRLESKRVPEYSSESIRF